MSSFNKFEAYERWTTEKIEKNGQNGVQQEKNHFAGNFNLTFRIIHVFVYKPGSLSRMSKVVDW